MKTNRKQSIRESFALRSCSLHHSSALPVIFILLIILSCTPSRKFENSTQPPAPDYTKEVYWIALPWRTDMGDSVPRGCNIPENQKIAGVDVFYVNPTVHLVGTKWNGDLSNKRLNERCARCVKYQGTAFNATARVFAPYYRQAHIKAFFDEMNGPKALDLAYSDVKAAFEHYLKNWNNGRPIIIAGHSQGARHALHLLKDFFDGKELQKQLVAAYPIGIPLQKKELKNIPLCDSAAQTGCYITWNTVVWGAQSKGSLERYKGSANINPLTWRADTLHAPASLNLGGYPFKPGGKNDFPIRPQVSDAKIAGDLLWIHPPKTRGFFRLGPSYHVSDYSLFYMNIRQNAVERVNAFLRKK